MIIFTSNISLDRLLNAIPSCDHAPIKDRIKEFPIEMDGDKYPLVDHIL